MTNKERVKILEMVAAGKLSVEQAGELMDILGAKSATDAEKRSDQELRANKYNQEAMGKIRGYRRAWDRGLRAAGLPNLTVEEIGALMNNGVSAEYIRALLETGLSDLTVKQIIRLKSHGVDPLFASSYLNEEDD
jgi:hypothetical protein